MRALNLPTAWEYEVIIYAMMWFISLALSFTQKQKANIELDLFISRLSEKRREVLTAAIYFVSLVFSVIFAYYAFRMFLTSYLINEQGSYFLNVQLWWVKLAFFVGTLLLTVQIIRMLVSQCHILYKRAQENGKELRNNLLMMLPVFAVLSPPAWYLDKCKSTTRPAGHSYLFYLYSAYPLALPWDWWVPAAYTYCLEVWIRWQRSPFRPTVT